MSTHQAPLLVSAIQPVSIKVVPVHGYLNVMVDPTEVLSNPDAADMVAEVIRGIAAGRGDEALIYGACISDALSHAPPLAKGELFMFHIPHH
ncbi:hypothetical protein [Stenotrophomonas pigmentata]|uniref:hypothetical protein n=1 Tax=Stenotrophomonas pigmentata TaxID=3055080 RepID=UPI0026EF9F4D|nr:hypothetical protein [Stenotrophomonas sp. 610A2]